MRASEFEFRHRTWFIMLIFALAFGSYAIEPTSVVEWLFKTQVISGLTASHASRGVAGHLIFALCAILLGAAAWIRTWGTAYLNNEVVQDRVVRADRLVADGPYRYVRNPLYIGTVLLAIGLAPMATPIGCVVLVVGMLVFILRLIGREERFLLEEQGDAYQAYLERVPRLWPSLRPRVPAGRAVAGWGQAWVGEILMWIVFAGSTTFAVTLNAKLFDYIVWSGLALWIPVRIYMQRRVA